MQVDAIINSANQSLNLGGGVSKAIADAAGTALVQDCNAYIKRSGKLQVSKIYVSISGNLKCKAVMHTVGPMYNHKKHDECCKILYTTVMNCLLTASFRKYKSIAIPAISSGMST